MPQANSVTAPIASPVVPDESQQSSSVSAYKVIVVLALLGLTIWLAIRAFQS